MRAMSRDPGTTTYALLALLAVQPWTGYELTKQAQRSLHFVWPSSEAHLYREQRRLVNLGWADVRRERVGDRERNRYSITPSGRAALRKWLRTAPAPPHLEIEGVLRTFFAEQGTAEDLVRSLEATASGAREVTDQLVAFARAYLEGDAPFPERFHVIALAMELLTQTYGALERTSVELAREARGMAGTKAIGMDNATRRRFENIVRRQRRKP